MADGLFGPQMTQEQYDYQQGLKNAAIPLAQKLGAMNYAAGSGLTRGVGSLFGVDMQSPELARASKLRELGIKYGTDTADAYDKIAAELQASGDLENAQKARAQADTMRTAATDIAKKKAETLKLTAEATDKTYDTTSKKARIPALKAEGLTDDQARAIASSDTAFSNFVKSKNVETPHEYALQAGKLGFDVKPFLSDYSADQLKAIEKGLFQHKAGIASAGRATTINQQESAFSKKMGELQANDYMEVQKQAKSSAATLDTLKSMDPNADMYGGPLAAGSIAAGQFLSSLGLLSPEEAAKLATSEVYDKNAKKLVLQDLGGKLGAQISDSDRRFIEAIIPQLKNSPSARTKLLNKLKEVHSKNIQNYQAMRNHLKTNKDFNNFDPTALYGYGAASGNNKKTELTVEDQQALEWANANPKDPRAAQIKQKLGQ